LILKERQKEEAAKAAAIPEALIEGPAAAE
jgi:hypothetical protein